MSNLLKKSLKWLAYLSAIVFIILAIIFLEDRNLILSALFTIASFAIYTYLIIKDYKFLSVISYITLLLSILIIMGIAGGDVSGGAFTTADLEKTYYITLSILTVFIIPFCAYLITLDGWRKKLSRILLVVNIALTFVMGMASPTFHNNFIYTRIFIGIAFIYSIYLIFKKEKLPRVMGIIGMFASVGALLLGALLFAGQTYTIGGVEKEKVVNFIEPKVQTMFLAYNRRDSQDFCKHCSEGLSTQFSEETLENLRNMYGLYISHEGPDITWTTGSYSIDYIVKFEKMRPIYFTLMIEQAEPENTIYGFNLSPEKPEQAEPIQ